ncbi:helix-turn-helix transcriptional regulator [Actinoplanes sp. CA-030573]|uniref:helix-turn-helix transcriptional regulator n=1 Tax=Actinoplanes sp. CA-030573 TaxID=3239898 RepID=UPI003D941204
MTASTSTEFGRAVRRWRERLTPQAVGLPPGGRRRAAGLRREELGLLAGISVDYIIRLEQGRATAPSAQVVEALSRALRLDGGERDLIFRLAGLEPPGRGRLPVHLTPGVQRLLDRLSGTPVSVHDGAWNLITANQLWVALMGDLLAVRGRERNIVWRHFTDAGSRITLSPAQASSFEGAMIGDLRSAAVRYPSDPSLRDLIADLRRVSPRFARLWDDGIAAPHESGRKNVDHPVVGRMELDCDVLTVPGSDVKIVAYTAEPGSESESRLALLSVVGSLDPALRD